MLQLLRPATGSGRSALRGSENLQILDDRPDLVPRELALESRHVVDLRAQLHGVTVPDLVEQHALRVDRVAQLVGQVGCVIGVGTVALAFRAMRARTVRGEDVVAPRYGA